MIKLSLTMVDPLILISTGSGLIPVEVAVQLDGSGGVVVSDVIPIYIHITDELRDSVTLSIENAETGVDWELSFDQNNWFSILGVETLEADTVTTFYAKANVINDGSLPSLQAKTACNIKLQSREVF